MTMRMKKKKGRSSLSTLRRSTRICSEWVIRTSGTGMSMMRRKMKMMRVRMRTISIRRMSSISRMLLVCKFTIPEQLDLTLEACLETNSEEAIILTVTNTTSLVTQLRNLRLQVLLSLKMTLKECPCLRCQSAVDNKDSLTLCLTTAMILCTLCKMPWMKRNSCWF